MGIVSMSQNRIKNLMIFVADSLRYDFLPDSIASMGEVVRSIAPSTHTPASFSSIVTGMNVRDHNVRGWDDVLDEDLQTVFDLFPNSEFYDHPNDPMRKILGFNDKNLTELTDMREPFIWMERAMDSHQPYGEIKHGNVIPDGIKKGEEYKWSLKRGDMEPEKEYKKGIRSVEKHFLSHYKELENEGLLKNTLVVFTSDHGEILNRWYHDCHNLPPCKELVEVPVVFIMDNSLFTLPSCMRSIDIIPTALDIMSNEIGLGEGISRKGKKESEVRGINQFENIKTEWKCTNNGLETTTPLKVIYHKMKSRGIRLAGTLGIRLT